MNAKETVKRYILFVIGLFFMGMGVAFTRHGELGVSPISSVANILSYKFTFFSIGNWLIITNTIFIIGDNGSGKSTLWGAMHILPDPNNKFIPGKVAEKEITLTLEEMP